MEPPSQISPISRLVTLLLCWFLGIFGIHRFYTGKHITGILMLLTIGGFGIWWFIDIIMILIGRFKDASGKQIFYWTEPNSLPGQKP